MNKFQWYSPQYIHTEKNADWYWIVGIITITVSAISIILNNLIFAIFLIISSFTLSLYASRKPENVLNEIGPDGIKKGSIFYPYSHIESFWVETSDKYPRIILKLRQKLSQFVIILIDSNDEQNIKNILSQYSTEEKMSESIFEKLFIYFGF